MKQFLVEESERIQILQKHKSLLKEQTVSDQDKLNAGHRAGCFGTYPVPNGSVGVLSSGQHIFSKPSKSKPGEFVRFLPNNTYYFYNPKTKQSTQAFKNPNPCPEMENFGKPTEQQLQADYTIQELKNQGFATLPELRAKNEVGLDEINNPAIWEKQTRGNVDLYKRKKSSQGTLDAKANPKDKLRNDWIEYLSTVKGYEVNPTVQQRNEWRSKKLYELGVQGLEPGVFDADQLVWIDPTKNRESTQLKSKQEKEDVERSVCRDRVTAFWNEFKNSTGLQITDLVGLQQRRDEVQFCKNKYQGDWGLFGGKKLDNWLDILSGRESGGPSSSGSDSVFRLQ